MQNTYVDFRAVKEAVNIRMALEHYGVNWLRKSGDELRGRCPIHKGEGQNTFHANLNKNAFQCFSCQARGNVLDFVAAMEQCTVRDAAVKLAEWFSIGGSGVRPSPERKSVPAKSRGEAKPQNKPLTFQLKGVDPDHPYLRDRGIREETAEVFGVGFFPGRGSMSGRIVIPIHNERGELIAYAGRSIDGSEPRYKVPGGFRKSDVLYNLHRVTAQEVIIVEGFFDCMKVWQYLHPSVVGLMGSSLSEHQERALVRQFKKVTLLLDGDEAGRRATEEIASRLTRKLFVRIIDLPEGKQPDQLSPEEIDELLPWP